MSERKSKPSASGMERIRLCRGSFMAEQASPDTGSDEYSETGDLIHEALAGNIDPATLGGDEFVTYRKCRDIAAQIIKDELGCPEAECDLARTESRFWLTDPVTLEPITSGKADLIVKRGRKGLVIDYKTLYGEQAEAENNMQLRTLAVLLDTNYPGEFDEISVALIHPNIFPTFSGWSFDVGEIQAFRAEVEALALEAVKANQPLTPGEKQCKFCRAKALCKAAQGALESTALIKFEPQAVTNDKLAALLDVCPIAEDVIDAIKAEAKRRIGEGQEIPGYQITKGRTLNTVTNPKLIFHRAEMLGITPDRYILCCNIVKERLEYAVRDITGCDQEQASKKVDELFAGATTETRAAGSLRKKSQKKGKK